MHRVFALKWVSEVVDMWYKRSYGTKRFVLLLLSLSLLMLTEKGSRKGDPRFAYTRRRLGSAFLTLQPTYIIRGRVLVDLHLFPPRAWRWRFPVQSDAPRPLLIISSWITIPGEEYYTMYLEHFTSISCESKWRRVALGIACVEGTRNKWEWGRARELPLP